MILHSNVGYKMIDVDDDTSYRPIPQYARFGGREVFQGYAPNELIHAIFISKNTLTAVDTIEIELLGSVDGSPAAPYSITVQGDSLKQGQVYYMYLTKIKASIAANLVVKGFVTTVPEQLKVPRV